MISWHKEPELVLYIQFFIDSLTYIVQGYFTGIEAIMRLSPSQWSYNEEYGQNEKVSNQNNYHDNRQYTDQLLNS